MTGRRFRRVKKLTAAVAFPLLFTVAGCGGGSAKTAAPPAAASPVAASPAPSPAGMSQKQQADAYLAAVAPGNAAIRTFSAKVNDTTPNAITIAEAAKLSAAIRQMGDRLARIAFTGQAVTDVRQMIAADSAMAGDLDAISNQTAFSFSQFYSTLSRDVSSVGSASTIIRADLGLPPYKP